MKVDVIISMLLVGCCCIGIVAGAGNDFKIGKKQDDPLVQPRATATATEKPTTAVEVNWCPKSDDKCPINVCQQEDKVCCWCDRYNLWEPFGAIQPCVCCPEDHVCCSSSKPLKLKPPPTCCPPNTECSADGCSCLQKTESIPACVQTTLCDPTREAYISPKLPNKDRSVSNTIW